MNKTVTSILSGCFMIYLAKSRKELGGKNKLFKYTGISCPMATDTLVEYSTNEWVYPALTEEVSFQDFLQATNFEGQDLGFYIPKKGVVTAPHPEYKNDRVFVRETEMWDPERDVAHHESFFKTTLPLNINAYVWQYGGIEHWFTESGEIDPEIISKKLEEIEETLYDMECEEGIDVTLQHVMALVLDQQTD